MKSLCENVEPFADGALGPADAEAFRDHAATCEACQAELAELAQLHALEHRLRRRLSPVPPAPEAPPPGAATALPMPRRKWIASGALASVASVALVMLSVNVLDRVPDSAFYPDGQVRLTEARSSHPQAGSYRPLKQGKLGGPDPGGAGQSRAEVARGKLAKRDDKLGVAALYLAQGTAADAQQALRALAELPESADVLSEQAYAYLVNGDAEQSDAEMALRLAERAVQRRAGHGPALWNRALAHRALGLNLLAARDFEAVADLGEPGWKDEARTRAVELRRRVRDAEKAWLEMLESGQRLVATGAFPEPRLLRQATVLRHYFYDAVRARASKQDVLDLLPLAEAAGDPALVRYVRDTAGRSFAVRGPLARDYARLAAGDKTLDSVQLLRRLRASGEADLILGAAAKLDAQLDVKELQELARKTMQDAWLYSLARQLEADALQKQGKDQESRTAYEEALRACTEAGLEYRCVEVQLLLTYAFDRGADLEQGLKHARKGWKAALRANEWGRQTQFVLELAQLTRQRQDLLLSRAYYLEALERAQAHADNQRYAHEGLAILDVHHLHFAEARRHLDAVMATGRSLGLTGALALSDVARVSPSPKDAEAMDAFRLRPSGRTFGEGERALAAEALGRWAIESGQGDGAERLRRVIHMATDKGLSDRELALRDPYARKALAYAYTSLILDAGKRRDANAALQLFEEEWLAGEEGTLPSRCLLAVTVDGERTLAIARGADGGQPALYYDDRRLEPLPRDLSKLLPAELVQPLAGCATVAVLARAPVYGRPGLLPNEIAWSYLGLRATQDAGTLPGRRLHRAGQEVAMSPARRGVRSPPRWQVPGLAGEHLEELTDQEATPSAVLRWMEDASDITFVTHALVNPDSEEAYLLLAPEPGTAPDSGSDALKASDLQRKAAKGPFLRGRPLVFLTSCKGAQPGPVLHEARNLPAAFLQAGARAVLAASDDLPDRDGPRFFNGVRERILKGVAPAAALRAERAEWLARDPGAAWLNGVLLFQ